MLPNIQKKIAYFILHASTPDMPCTWRLKTVIKIT